MKNAKKNLTVGRSLRYGALHYTITKIAKGKVFIYNELHGTLSIDWMRAVRWTEQGVFQFDSTALNQN